MNERPENFRAADDDPEATLVAPRFDDADARRAHPVVPLAEASARTPLAPRPRRGHALQRRRTHALLAVALLAVTAVGGALATKVMRAPRAEQTPEQIQTAPPLTAEAPPPQPATVEPARQAAPAASLSTRTRRARAAAAQSPRDFESFEEDEDEDRRGRHSEKRRERDEEEVEKELRRALKRAKKGAHLVDVLTRP